MSKYQAKKINGIWYLVRPDKSKVACTSEKSAQEAATVLNANKRKKENDK